LCELLLRFIKPLRLMAMGDKTPTGRWAMDDLAKANNYKHTTQFLLLLLSYENL
jgi:hypothetical protein